MIRLIYLISILLIYMYTRYIYIYVQDIYTVICQKYSEM